MSKPKFGCMAWFCVGWTVFWGLLHDWTLMWSCLLAAAVFCLIWLAIRALNAPPKAAPPPKATSRAVTPVRRTLPPPVATSKGSSRLFVPPPPGK